MAEHAKAVGGAQPVRDKRLDHKGAVDVKVWFDYN